jgi:hypothetical protein
MRQPSRAFRAGSVWALSLFALAALTLAAPAAAKQVLPKRGGQIPVNTTTSLGQSSPAVAADAQGNFAVAWLGPDATFHLHVFARLFGAGGAPRSPEILVDATPSLFVPLAARVAMDGAGRFVVVWFDHNVWLRRFDSQGAPLGDPQRVDQGVGFLARGADVAMGPAGGFAAVWVSDTNGGAVYARRYDPEGTPLEAPVRLDAAPVGVNVGPRVAASATGGDLVAWWREKSNDLITFQEEAVARRTAGATAAWTPEMKVNTSDADVVRFTLPVFHADGGFSVVWQHLEAKPGQLVPRALRARRFDAAGEPQGGEVTLPFDPLILEPPAVATDPHGNALVVVAVDGRPEGRLFDSAWHPVGELFEVTTFPNSVLLEPAVAAAGEGFATVWTSRLEPVFTPCSIAKDDFLEGILGQLFAPPLCAPGSRVLCLGAGGRFELTADWKTPAGDAGSGRALPVTGASGVLGDTGGFWFFDSSNLELLTKVLDGRAVNGSFWLFSGALSNVDYTLHVTDTASGTRRDYHNAQGQLTSRADTAAFRDGGGGNGGAPPAPVFAANGADTAGAAGEGLCPDLPKALCLGGGRLAVEVSFVDPRSGAAGQGHPTALTADTGTFWFFAPNNVELAVKVLDGGAVNDFFWLFSAGMSTLDYTVKVTDRTTGAVKTYHNAPGALASRADTRLFPAPH